MSDSRDAAGPQSGGPPAGKRGRWVPKPGSAAWFAERFGAEAAAHAAAIERATAPLRAAHFEAERTIAPLRKIAEQAERSRRLLMGDVGWEYAEDEGSEPTAENPVAPPAAGSAGMPEAPPPADRWKPPATTDRDTPEGWPAYERRDAPAWFVGRIREWWRPFDPAVPEHWFDLEKELVRLHGQLRPDSRSREEFQRDRLRWTAEDAVSFMERVRLIPPGKGRGGRPHKRTVDNLTVDQWVAAMAAADPSFRHLSQREAANLGPFSPRAIGKCSIWRQMKADLETEAREKAEQARAELEDRESEDEGEGGRRLSSTKRGIGIQRTTPQDREHERNVDAFLRSKGERPKKRRAK